MCISLWYLQTFLVNGDPTLTDLYERRSRWKEKMLRGHSIAVTRLTASHITRPKQLYYRHQPLFVRAAVRPTTRSSHHPTNLPQVYPRSSPFSRKNSTLSNSRTATPSRRMRFVRRFVETVISQESKKLTLSRQPYQV